MDDFNWGRDDKFKWGSGSSKSIANQSRSLSHKRVHDLQPISADEYVDLARESMGMIERFQFDRENKKAVKEYSLQVAGDLAKKQRELIEKRIQYDFDVEQKKLFSIYLNEVKSVDIHLENSLKQIELSMTEFFAEHILTLKLGQNHYSSKFNDMVKSGLLQEEDANDLNAMINSKVNRVTFGASNRFDILIKSYGKQYEIAMAKIKEEVINRII